MTSFHDLGLDPALLKALDGEGYTTPTPIQLQAIPSLLAGKDLLGIAQTGTGKTAAFALPILQRLAADRKPAPRNGARALILSPTRELASQIADSFKTYGRHFDFTVATIFGGVGYKPQTQALQRGIDILVATPGRLIDHMTERTANLGSTEILVLDEADQMMDLGFIRPLRQIISKLPSRRQSMFFSATMPHEIGALAAELLRDPVKVSVTPAAKTADRVEQKIIFIEAQKKRSLLVELFADASMSRTLVFTRTKRGADKVARHLEGAGISAAAIHGNKSQGQREAALSQFKASKIRALIATDIAARGIDIDQVSHVVNYELPNVPESYVHRIGRTARAGAEGIAISLCDGEERAYLRDIERLTRQTIPSVDRRGDVSIAVPAEDRGASRSDSGDRRGHGDKRGGRDRGHGGHGRNHGGDRDNHRHSRSSDGRGAERHRPSEGRSERSSERPSDRHASGERPSSHGHGRNHGHALGANQGERAERNGQRPHHQGARRHEGSRADDHRNGPRPHGHDGRDGRRNGDGHSHRGSRPAQGRPHAHRSGNERRGHDADIDNGGLSNVAFLAGGRRANAGPSSGKPHRADDRRHERHTPSAHAGHRQARRHPAE